MKLNDSELFVATSLVTYFKNSYNDVAYRPVKNDPPDIYLKIDEEEFAVEITEININTLNNRTTIDCGYIYFIDDLKTIYKDRVENNNVIFISFYHHYTKISKKIKKELEKELKLFLSSTETKLYEGRIDDVYFKIEKSTDSISKDGRISGLIYPYGGKNKRSKDINLMYSQIADCNIDIQSTLMIEERILTKNEKCQHLEANKIWLVLHDMYYNFFTQYENNEHKKHYTDIMQNIKDFGDFAKILIVFGNKDVVEFDNEKF